MHIVPIAWLYVVALMAVVEAASSTGTVLGAVVTFVLYGVLPITLVMYLLGTPLRWRNLKSRQRAEAEASAGTAVAPDGGGETPAAAVAPVREET